METAQFVHLQNIEHYKRVLAETINEDQRQKLLKLLAEEKMRAERTATGTTHPRRG